MWDTFSGKSTLSKDDFFKYFENISEGCAIFISNLTKFEYPIALDFEWEFECCQVDSKNKKFNFLLNFK